MPEQKWSDEARRHYEAMARLHQTAMLRQGVQFNSLEEIEDFVRRIYETE